MLDAGVHGAAHRRLPLQRPPAADPVSRLRGGARQVPDQSRQRRHGRAARRAVRDDLQRGARPRQAGAHRRQRRLAQPGARRREDAGEHRPRSRARSPKRSSTSAWCSRPCESTELALESGLRKDQIIISCKTSRPRDLIAVYRDLARETDQPLHLGPDRSRHGHQGARLVGVGDGRAAERRHRRHDPRVADAAAGRRPPRGGLRGVRAAAGARPALVLAERHGLPRLRPHDHDDVPGARRADAGLRPRARCRSGRRSTKASRP